MMNKYNPNIHHRRSIRLKGYDYSQAGLYFITICVQHRECLFGEIVGAPLVGAQRDVVTQHDDDTKKGQPQGIAQHDDDTKKGQPQGIAPTVKNNTVGDMVGAFQSIVTVEYIRGVKSLGWQSFNGKLWQRNYYEHIIRDESSYHRISNYINNNPTKWADDKFYTQ